ncbi:MAG: hybrid sensor histidine kinase/response regulator [Chloroflexota bacterium]
MTLVLIVDDEMYQRTLIRETLAIDRTLNFIDAENGQQALELVEYVKPDVILLDVMMPTMNGFQVCQKIKANPQLQTIPIILVTALGQLTDKVTGLDSGADDFVNKPFEEAELQARVRSALRVKALYDDLATMSHMRDSLVRMLMHDMGNLVTIANSALELSYRFTPDSPGAIECIREAHETNVLLGEMISDALDINSLETQRMPINREVTDVVALLHPFVERYQAAAEMSGIQIDFQVAPDAIFTANVDKSLLRRIVGNLLTNALKYAPSDSTITVYYGLGEASNTFRIVVNDTGPGIPLSEQANIFDKYAQAQLHVKQKERFGRGLGLTFSKMAVEAHEGTITVHSTPGEGATFTVEIPFD